jgi:hypothetical protein
MIERVEDLFGLKSNHIAGDVKRNLGITRLRLRGLTGAQIEFLLTATVQNLKRLVFPLGNTFNLPAPLWP